MLFRILYFHLYFSKRTCVPCNGTLFITLFRFPGMEEINLLLNDNVVLSCVRVATLTVRVSTNTRYATASAACNEARQEFG